MSTIAPHHPRFTTPFDELRDEIRGDVLVPHDDGWDQARAAWNLAADQRPPVVAQPVDAGDVITVVQFARRHGLKIAPQGTGHNATALAPLHDTVLLSTRRMRGVQIDRVRRRARVAAGTLWGDVTEAATPFGLFPLSGSSPDVGIVGYTLGGGLSWLGRHHGLAANHVTAIEVVTPAGALVRATPTDHRDLFWALRGGGGNFGVVTALEMRLFPHGDDVYAGMFLWPYERHAEVLYAWRNWTRTAPTTATTSFRIMHFPPLPELPPFLAGRSVVLVDGAVAAGAAGAAAVGPFRDLEPELDTWAPSTPAALGRIHMDPEQPTPVRSSAMLVDDLDDAALEAFASALPPTCGLLLGEIRHLGGALGRAPAGAGVVGSLPGEYLLYAGAITPTREALEVADRAMATLHVAMAPYDNGRAYGNFVERPLDTARLYTADDHARLQRIRAAVDPDGLMVANHPVAVNGPARPR